jgi:hypothetical protein
MYTLKKVQEYLNSTYPKISNHRIKECYDLIDNPKNRLEIDDLGWDDYGKEHEYLMFAVAISNTLKINNQFNPNIHEITQAVKDTYSDFIFTKDRYKIPFYIGVIDKLY